MNHQDWEPVVLRKKLQTADLRSKDAIAHAQRTGQRVETNYKDKTREERDRMRKLEVDLGSDTVAPPPLPTLNKQMQQVMIQARVAKNLTQDTLAKSINEPIQIIKDLETGKVINKPGVLQKINRLLGISLRLG